LRLSIGDPIYIKHRRAYYQFHAAPNTAARSEQMTTAAKEIAELMNGWNTIMAAARREFPAASEEELFQIASGAMRHALGL
jgi:hypothetical protein